MIKKNFITLLSSYDYLNAVIVLDASLKKVRSIYYLVVAIPETLFNDDIKYQLESRRIHYEIINLFEYNDNVKKTWHKLGWDSTLNTASKYSLFDLKQYDKMVYIDADTLVLSNIDDLMNYPDGSMVWNKNWKENGCEPEGFSGLFVFIPNNHRSDFYKILSDNIDEVDGGLFGKLWFPVKSNPDYQIPAEYCYGFNLNEFKTDIKIAHFYGENKPWKKEIKGCTLESLNIINYYYQLMKELNLTIPNSL